MQRWLVVCAIALAVACAVGPASAVPTSHSRAHHPPRHHHHPRAHGKQAVLVAMHAKQDGAASEEASVEADALPLGAKCFLWLAGAFSMVTVVTYFYTRFRAVRSAVAEDSLFEKLDRVFTDEALANAKQALAFTPTACLLVLFLTLRAHTQLIADNDPDYRTLQLGFQLLTGGLLILFVQSFSLTIHSAIWGNVGQVLGDGLIVVGLAIVLWGMEVVTSDQYDTSTAGCCIAALAWLSVPCVIGSKAIATLRATLVPGKSNAIDEYLDDTKLDTILAAQSFSPMVLIVLVYLYFVPWSTQQELHPITEDVIIATTVGVFVQALCAILGMVPNSPIPASWTRVVQVVGLLLLYASFTALLFCVVSIDAPSIAISNMQVLVFVIAILALLAFAFQEGFKKHMVDKPETILQITISNTHKLIKALLTNQNLATILSVLLLFIHFRADILLNEKAEDNIRAYALLPPVIVVATASVFVHMAGCALEMVFPGQPFPEFIQNIAIAGEHVGLFGLVVAALS